MLRERGHGLDRKIADQHPEPAPRERRTEAAEVYLVEPLEVRLDRFAVAAEEPDEADDSPSDAPAC